MLRLSHLMRTLANPAPVVVTRRRPAIPVVIWNLIRRCNLTCRHCYATSADKDFDGELSTAEAMDVLQDLKNFGIPALILSGGEPLMRPDIFALSRQARSLGLYTALSSNGTLIDEKNAKEIAGIGYDYVGVSIDGLEATHDFIRRKKGAFAVSMKGIRLLKEQGVKVGLRLTLTRQNATELPELFRMMEQEGIDKFYLSHLNYAGRGNTNRRDDAHHQHTREVMQWLCDKAWLYIQNGYDNSKKPDVVTGNNDADAVFLLDWARRYVPDEVPALTQRLEQCGGNAAGMYVANINYQGDVHPDTMWQQTVLGNVRERAFSEIWSDDSQPLLNKLRQRPRRVEGRCARCRYLSICNGNTRVRALQTRGDMWAEDPGCYLSDEEIELSPVLHDA